MKKINLSMSSWICYTVGYVFITSGVIKLFVPSFKVFFSNLGLPFPHTSVFLVAMIEIGCGELIVAKMYLKEATIALMIIMAGAIYLTKIPVLLSKGLLQFAFEARLDVVMMILLFILWREVPGTKFRR